MKLDGRDPDPNKRFTVAEQVIVIHVVVFDIGFTCIIKDFTTLHGSNNLCNLKTTLQFFYELGCHL